MKTKHFTLSLACLVFSLCLWARDPYARIEKIDSNQDQKIDIIREYDHNGKPIHEQLDLDFNGIFEVDISWQENGIEITKKDANQDGIFDSTHEKHYYQGNITYEIFEQDLNQDGKPDRTREITYNLKSNIAYEYSAQGPDLNDWNFKSYAIWAHDEQKALTTTLFR